MGEIVELLFVASGGLLLKQPGRVGQVSLACRHPVNLLILIWIRPPYSGPDAGRRLQHFIMRVSHAAYQVCN